MLGIEDDVLILPIDHNGYIAGELRLELPVDMYAVSPWLWFHLSWPEWGWFVQLWT